MRALALGLSVLAIVCLAIGVGLKFAIGCWIGNWLFGLFGASAIAAAFVWLRISPKIKTG